MTFWALWPLQGEILWRPFCRYYACHHVCVIIFFVVDGSFRRKNDVERT